MKQTHKLQFLIKTRDSIFNQNRGEKSTKHSLVWVFETGSILIKEKRKHLSKMSDMVSRKCFAVQVLEVLSREGFIEVYINNRRIFVIV